MFCLLSACVLSIVDIDLAAAHCCHTSHCYYSCHCCRASISRASVSAYSNPGGARLAATRSAALLLITRIRLLLYTAQCTLFEEGRERAAVVVVSCDIMLAAL